MDGCYKKKVKKKNIMIAIILYYYYPLLLKNREEICFLQRNNIQVLYVNNVCVGMAV